MSQRENPQNSSQDVADLLGGAFAGHTMQRLRTPDGKYRYSYVSSGVQASFGLDPEALMQLQDVDHSWLHPADRSLFIAALEQSAAALTRLDEEVRVSLDDGTFKWVRSIGNPRRMRDGTVIWDGVALDVTDRHEASEALERTLTQVRQNETSEGRFSYIAASDVLDRLSSLRAAVEQLDLSVPTAAHVHAVFQKFERGLFAARDLLDDTALDETRPTDHEPHKDISATLTPRQQDILGHVSRGATNRDIARAMDISEGTVKLHISAILKRTGAQNRTEAALAWTSSNGTPRR
ncbi:LuxR C-terminal-related transcriptional regulator [Jannaschia sp. CCS1]|uniref:LuxR C-terminal-related transcriptional regulator n=1 Tax=Jannaschia sp. (strain CCS1) TaxID=290400 RepID=UPI000053B9C3|nr:LuxR C-terminal-related transcriptional regulator [Jannaschia sp. CCS1]ABD56003.1 transcriptional regulator, LuxR family [Jannaschia sp. CCS1]